MHKEDIVNKVDESGLVQLDLSQLYRPGTRSTFDLASFLHEGLVLKEKDFRQQLADCDWSVYRGCFVAVTCTADAIVPTWAFMLAAVHLAPVAECVVMGTPEALEETLFLEAVAGLDAEAYRDRRVVVKGCGEKVPAPAYVALVNKLQPVVKSLMFGEPCSTVPLYKV